MDMPYDYQYINTNTSRKNPSYMHINGTGINLVFERYFLNKAISVLKWELPKSWAKNYFLYTYYRCGFIAIVNTDKFGVIPQHCGLYGYNVMYQPTHAIISNPLLKGLLNPLIDRQCIVMKLLPDYGGIMDIVSQYANLAAVTLQGAGVNIINSKLAYVFMTDNKAGAETFKKTMDDIIGGQAAVVTDKRLFKEDGSPAWKMFNQNVGQTYIADKLLEDLDKIENMFDTRIGIPSANTYKKERLITAEIESNQQDTKSIAELILENAKEGVEKTRKMFGIKDFSVDWRFQEGGDTLAGSLDKYNRDLQL